MQKRTTTKAKSTTAQQKVKFTKGEYYQDLGGDPWFCTDAKQKKVGDDQVMMQQTEEGQPVGDATEQPIGAFNRQLSSSELKEYRLVSQRERDAEGKTAIAATPATKTTGKPKAKKAPPATEQPKKMSALDAAAKVLSESKEPMATKEMIDAMSARGYLSRAGIVKNVPVPIGFSASQAPTSGRFLKRVQR